MYHGAGLTPLSYEPVAPAIPAFVTFVAPEPDVAPPPRRRSRRPAESPVEALEPTVPDDRNADDRDADDRDAERAAERERRGVLYVFMPPQETLEDYLELLAAVEATAAQCGVKIVLEGYPPPRDPRLKTLAVTPDPGVIEVNIHPAHDWTELVDHLPDVLSIRAALL